MIYLLCIFGGIVYGICIAGVFTFTKEQSREDELNAAIREAYLQGYEAGIEDSEKID